MVDFQTKKMRNSFLTALFVTAVYTFLYVPIIVLVVFSFNRAAFPAPWTEFTFHWYEQLWYNSDQIWHALYNSLIVSCSATALSLIMGIALMYYVVRGGKAKTIMNIFYANLIVPEIVMVVGLLGLFTFFSVPLGKMALIAGHTLLGLGYAVPLLYMRYEEIDCRLIEASLDLGANYTQTFMKIIMPLLLPAIIMAALLVFIISFDDFVISYFCAGMTSQTLPVYLLSMLRTGASPVINALSTGLLFLSGFLVLGFCVLRVRMNTFNRQN